MQRKASLDDLRLADLYAPILGDLKRARQILADELISDQAFISDLCRHVGQFHGKLLRPALLLLTAQACGGVRPAHHALGAVVELVHISTLVHDDVLDESDIRRRAATVNSLWGNARAVLMGDFLYSHAYHLCASVDAPSASDDQPRTWWAPLASRLIGQTAVTVCEGEMMQVANRGNLALSEPEYLDIITRKTAALVETCCHLGAVYAGADERTVRRMCAFGNAVGIAFQIVDDILDLTGDAAEVGKSLHRDLDEGELTLPIIHYLATAAPERRARMRELLETRDASRTRTHERLEGRDASRVREIVALLRESASVDYAQAAAASFITTARDSLSELPPSPARDSLATMAEFVLARRQ